MPTQGSVLFTRKLRPQCGQGAEAALAAEDVTEKCGRSGALSAESNGRVGKWLDELECSWIEAMGEAATSTSSSV